MKASLIGLSLAVMSVTLISEAKELAKVNGRSITERDLALSLNTLNDGQRETLLKDNNSRRQILANVIDREILAQEAEKLKLDQEPEFKEAVEQVRKQMLMNRLLEKKIATQLSRNEVKKYYELHKDRYSSNQVRVQQILVSDENEAKKMLEMAKDPKNDFQNLAEKYSKDPNAKNNRGDLGFIGHDKVVPEFADAAFQAKEGEITGPIRTAYGYHIIKVIKKLYGKPLEFDEVELRVADTLRQNLIRNFVDSLKPQNKVSVDDVAVEKLF